MVLLALMNLKAQDIMLLLGLHAIRRVENKWTYAELGHVLALSSSEVHASVKRCRRVGLLYPNVIKPNRHALLELLIHGVKYVFPPERGPIVRGIPTAYAAPPLAGLIVLGNEPPPVWPYPSGTVRGESFSPLYKSVPTAAVRHPVLYEYLALVDAIRGGRARERALAEEFLQKRLS